MERIQRKRKLTSAEAARDREIRAQFSHKPSKRQLLASADYVGPMSIEEFLTWRTGHGDALR